MKKNTAAERGVFSCHNKSVLSPEEKARAVKECLSGEIRVKGCARKYGIDDTVLSDWIRLYKARGIEGLTPGTRAKEVKIQAVTDYLSGAILDLARRKFLCKRRNPKVKKRVSNDLRWGNIW